MGVAWVFETEEPLGGVEREMLVGGAEIVGTYTVDSVPYTPNETGIGMVFLMHHSHFPYTTFSLGQKHKDSRDSFQNVAWSCSDRGFDAILHKLNAGVQEDSGGQFEVTGVEVSLKDFSVRYGEATQAGTARGTVVEVEYGPSNIASQAAPILCDFMTHFFPEYSTEEMKPEVIKRPQSEPYNAIETLHQYHNVFCEMRKRPM